MRINVKANKWDLAEKKIYINKNKNKYTHTQTFGSHLVRPLYIFSFFPFHSAPFRSPVTDKLCTFTQNQWTRRIRIYVCVCARMYAACECMYTVQESFGSRGWISIPTAVRAAVVSGHVPGKTVKPVSRTKRFSCQRSSSITKYLKDNGRTKKIKYI